MFDEFDNSSDELLETESTNPAAICFEEYQDCFGDAGDVMKKHLLCNMCGGHLHFNHLTDYPHGLIQETARCPDCGIRVRQRLHKLQ